MNQCKDGREGVKRMDREKQIEEMAVILTDGGCTKCNCDKNGKFNCLPMYNAELLYNAGYRKRSKGEWVEIQREWDFEPYFYTDYTCSVCGDREQDKRHFCPNCGAKMKRW